MPVTAGPVPGLTSDLHRVPMDPGRFHSGRWWLLAEGLLVSAYGVVGLISAALHPHAGRTGAPVFGLTSTPAHSALLLALGVIAVAAVAKRRAAITVTALSAVGYMLLLFFSSIGSARKMPTPMGFHATDIVLHGVLAVVNLALLMWLIPDELGDEVWAPRRGRDRDRQASAASEAVPERDHSSPGGAPAAAPKPTPAPEPAAHQSPAGPTSPPADDPAVERPGSPPTPQPNAGGSTPLSHNATRRSRGLAPAAIVVLVAVVSIIVWLRRR